ncbi:GGDEF domain-containing protein [Rubrivivax gelatinosus]|uniref:diguanylate cyclase n=1 Tax=Rubrivivax gelatinosus TaxID=28068 RepID=A0A4R2MFV3_RUBGE|nr:GGDEF domain-containing protein [Rubrivivax gelatinosus]MBK1689923.1 GGDEF domain-containing protein [Rubrivivax gelatinosus]TCP01606.1 diguanylate cyclase [Rubrivivax gelatinosus]
MNPPTPAQIAKGALRRLAMAKLEPTPEHYARAYAEEAGVPVPAPLDTKAQGQAWAALIEKLVKGVERGGRQWTTARKKESLQRVLDGSRGDLQRLLQRLQALASAWDGDRRFEDPEAPPGSTEDSPPVEMPPTAPAPLDELPAVAAEAEPWRPVVASLEGSLRAGLPPEEPRATEIADRLATLADTIAAEGLSAERVAEVDELCRRARRLFAHRHHLVEQLGTLCRELGRGLVEVAEDDSWARGQCESLEQRLADGVTARSVRAATELLAETRVRQQRVRDERNAARDALKSLIHRMLAEVGALGEHTGRFHESVGRHAEAVASAESLESLAGVVREIVDESRAVQELVGAAQRRMEDEHAKANELETRVRELEGELRRLSDEVSTDALTQVANRRGLAQAFDAERARVDRAGPEAPPLAIGLIDIDNFKKLNDTLGHAAGDLALKSLAAAVRERLRPVDHLARFGGEEFVVLLPATPLAEAQLALTRLQRGLTEALFLHEQREVFVTFSAGVTAWRPGEALEAALERADEALYEAKRSGKNRTCTA